MWRRASDASWPSAATARPSVPTMANASGVPRRGRGSSWTSATPTAGWAISHGSSSAMEAADRTSMRPGSTIAAASAAGRSSVGSNGRGGAPDAGGAPSADGATTASKSRRSWSSVVVGRSLPRPGPHPSGRPATRAAGTYPLCATERRRSVRCSAVSPAIGGRRSMRVRNSYSRKRRTTVSRS